MNVINANDTRVTLLGYNRPQLEAYFESLREKPYRARQMLKWVHQHKVLDFDVMTDMSRSLRSTLADEATFFEPHQHASGIDHVIVNGAFVVEDGEILFTLPGRVIPSRRGGTLSVSDGAGS